MTMDYGNVLVVWSNQKNIGGSYVIVEDNDVIVCGVDVRGGSRSCGGEKRGQGLRLVEGVRLGVLGFSVAGGGGKPPKD